MPTKTTAVVWCGLLLGLAAWAAGIANAETGLGRHKKLYAVPVPGPVAIDGKLDDWDLSGQIEMFVVSETKEMQSAKFAVMYDAQALYLSGVVRDPSPLMNRQDPQVRGDKGWDADSCQFRLILDPAQGYPVEQSSFQPVDNDQMAHLILWYYSDRQEPNLHMVVGMDGKLPRPEWAPHGVVPRNLFGAKYLLADDGRGYTFEYRIPWSTLGAKRPPKAGDLVAGTVQFNWGLPDGLKTAGGSAWAYDVMSGPGFPYQSSACWGKLIFSDRGRLPQEMVAEGLPPEKPLPLMFSYQVPEDCEASVCLFDAQGRVVRILVAQGARRAGENIERWDGNGDDGQPLPAGTYTWKGVYHKGLKTKFILSVHNSGQPPYKTDDNTGGWGGDHASPTTVCRAGDTMLLAWPACESGWGIIRTDLQGKKLWGSSFSATHLAVDGGRFFSVGDFGFQRHNGVRVCEVKDARPVSFSNGTPYLLPPPGGNEQTDEITGLACHAGVVYAAFGKRNLLAVYDSQAGTLKATWPVPNPGRLAPRPDGTLAVISGDKVVSVRDGQVTPLLSQQLDHPQGIAVADDGTLYVANSGALQNVSVFSATGQYLKSLGKPGGRPRVGLYDRAGILEPGGIALDQTGRLWVAETLDSPKRHSVWDVQTGACVQEFFGGSAYFGWAWMDPQHADEIYCHNVLWKVDLDRGTWRPHSTIWRATAPNMVRAATPDGYAGHLRVMTAKNGRQFAWGMTDYSNMLYMREGDIFKPVAGTIRVAFGPFGGGLPYPAMRELYERTKAGAFLWQDANNDQQVQPEELVVSPAGRGESAFNWIDADLNAWCDAGWIYRPVRFAADGRPVYDFSRAEPIPFKGQNSNGTSLWLDEQGGIYTLSPGSDPGLAKWTSDWKPVWAYRNIVPWPQALALPMVRPGLLHGLTMPLGVAGDFTGAVTYFGPYHIFTRDGIYVGMVMRDGRSGGLGADITATECIQGQLVKPVGMNRYFLLAGDQDGRVTEILGLDAVRRLPGGTYVHSEEKAQAAAQALKQYEAALARSRQFAIVRGRAALEKAPPVTKRADERRSFEVRSAYDEQNLYFAFDVTSPAPLTNSAADARTIFKGGNLLDLQLATDPQADPARKTPAPGDVRLLITRQHDQPLAVLYRPQVAGFRGEPLVLSSPTGKESFAVIETTPRVKLEYKPQNGRFTAVVTIPRDLLGLTIKPGARLKLDVGYIFGNAAGTQAALRSYWNNNSFTANVTYDIPSESRLEPHEWGWATVE